MTRSRMVGIALCGSLLLIALSPAGALGAGPVALWHLDEGAGQVAGDASGGASDGVLGLTSSVETQDPSWIPGRVGRALRFVGDRNEFVTVRPAAELRPQRITVQAWVRRQDSPGAWRYIVSMGGIACDRSSYGLYSGEGGGIAFYVSDSSRFILSPTLAASRVWDGQWHLVAGSYDGAHVRLFVDGAQIGTGTPAAVKISYSLPARNLLIGSYRAGCDLPFTGDIDEVGIWAGALTPDEIAAQGRDVAAVPPPVDAVPPVSGPPPGPAAVSRPGAPPLVRCFAVAVSSRTIRVGRRARIVVRIGRGKRPVAKALVRFRGPGVRISRLTDRAGRVRVVLHPRRRAKVRVTVRGQPVRCTGAVVTAR